MGLERGAVFCPFVFYFINSFDSPGFKSLPFGQTQALEEFGIESVAGLIAEAGNHQLVGGQDIEPPVEFALGGVHVLGRAKNQTALFLLAVSTSDKRPAIEPP